MLVCGIDTCYIVTSEKPSCLATVAAVCNVSRLALLYSGQTCLHILKNEHALLCQLLMVSCHFEL